MSDQPDIWKCPECGECLDISTFGFYTEVACPNCGHRAHVHTQLANFNLEGVLGVGGMSIVLRAQDLILNRNLAIKVLNDTYRDQPERIARFENECAMMARVRHENVVSVYSAGWARGQFYIAMEMVHGKNLETLITETGPMKPIRALDVTLEIVRGLQAAHRAGMLHRDMKPGNVIISQDGKAKVLDFGLSLNNKAEDTESVIWATPYYVPPETLKREAEDVRTDIYALGMTLRFLLTGQHNLPGDNSSLADLLRAKKHLAPLAGIFPECEPALSELVDRMTAFKPEDRPASYTSLLEKLAEVRSIQQELDDEKSPARVRRRMLVWAGAVGASVLLGLCGAAVTTCLSVPKDAQLALPYVDIREVGDFALLGNAKRGIKYGDWQKATSNLEALACSDTCEPTLAAMASLLRAYYAIVLEGDGAEAPHLERFRFHMKRTESVSPAGRELFSRMQAVVPALDALGDADPAADVTGPVLRAIVYAACAKHMAARGDSAAAAAAMSLAKEEFGKANARWGKSAMLLDGFNGKLTGAMLDGCFFRAQEALAKHNFSTADSELGALLAMGDALAPEARARATALLEISRVGQGVVEVLKSKKLGYRPGMSPAEMRMLAGKTKIRGFAEEVYALSLLLKGDYETAFDVNPYRVSPESTFPFAILMRSWQPALLPAAPEPAP